VKVFLDVGAHEGQSLVAALDPEFAFDRIVCFEPAPSCWNKLGALRDKRVKVEPFGLWNWTGEKRIFGAGRKGAGLWQKDGREDAPTVCRFVRASEWMNANIRSGDQVYLKLNCEGAECDILDDLIDSGEFEKVSFCMVDFDVRKIASMKHRQAETQARTEHYGFPRVATSKQVMKGETHADRIKNWLRLCR